MEFSGAHLAFPCVGSLANSLPCLELRVPQAVVSLWPAGFDS